MVGCALQARSAVVGPSWHRYRMLIFPLPRLSQIGLVSGIYLDCPQLDFIRAAPSGMAAVTSLRQQREE